MQTYDVVFHKLRNDQTAQPVEAKNEDAALYQALDRLGAAEWVFLQRNLLGATVGGKRYTAEEVRKIEQNLPPF